MKTILTSLLMLISTSVVWTQTDTETKQPELTEADQLLIAVQKICPVMGSELGSMGDPIKVEIDGQTAFLCCKGCQGKHADEEHWKTIQTNLAKAQGTCPIMGKPVDATMKSTVVEGRRIFVCCPPCIAKIENNVEESLKKINASYSEFVAKELQAHSDQLHIAAQGICPVSGKELGSMGDPIKVKVGEEEVAFLCCQGCVGKQIDADHWKAVQANLAKAQGTCPVMGKEVDSGMKSTVVNGRKIFVCCPPCIDKIQKDPAKFVAKLNDQIEANVDGDQ